MTPDEEEDVIIWRLNAPHSFGNYFSSDKPVPRSQCTCPCHDPSKTVAHGRECCYPDPPEPDEVKGFYSVDPDQYEYSREEWHHSAGCTLACSTETKND